MMASRHREVVGLELIKALLRFFSYLYHGLLCLLLIALAGLAMLAGGGQSLRLDMLPWTGTTLLYAMFFGGLAGLLFLLLALKAKLRLLFLAWSLAVTILLVKGYVFSAYRFSPGEVERVAYLIGGSAIALLGAWFQLTRRLRGRA
jgi:hypothetical protein